MNVRLRELDFLRGIAIILVLFRHIPIFQFTTRIGWMGVDLFFVLSGFLVSGLLFKEFIRFGTLNPKLFLIRRGFKIYPVYYLFYLPYLGVKVLLWNEFSLRGFLSDISFTQNYFRGWGWAYDQSWSLAVEEHFYFGFTLLLWMGLKKNWIQLEKEKWNKKFIIITIALMAIGLVFRIVNNHRQPVDEVTQFTMTHLRIDSLLMGVLISHIYYFNRNFLFNLVKGRSYMVLIMILIGLSWTIITEPFTSYFANTFGLSLVYLSFGMLLILFITETDINRKLDKYFTRFVVNLVSKIGYCSYSIYIIFNLVIIFVSFRSFHLVQNKYLLFLVAFPGCILAGMFITYKIEKYFLSVRNTYFPGRA